ncbi:MAG: hypothetical protein NUV68_07015 [Caldiserica bacterium]|nr:hypothetical protein [Caldisericota bacterium]MDH7563058.1 hypothetical protein [Caldisericota bacterium]
MERIQNRGKLQKKGKGNDFEKKGSEKFLEPVYRIGLQTDDPKALLRITARPI